jgi:hypothetical protein
MMNIMKKNLVKIVFIGVISMVAMSIQAQHHDNHNSDKSKIKIIQGKVVADGHHHNWDYVTFGLDSPDSYQISSVLIRDEKTGEILATINDLDSKRNHGITWYRIDLDELDFSGDFTLEIHISNVLDTTSGIGIMAKAISPIDPDETVILIRYP